MKVIDLLNKIANGEEVPKCIRYNNENYYFKDSEYRDFVNEEVIYSTLNDEIEIIEDKPKKIEKIPILILGETEYNKYAYDVTQIRADIDVLARQLNIITEKQCEIIDYINNMEE